ncbi:MAG: hypothetical protein FVQ83_10285 [Chloroflexi bacterium]|nr:hypothetical protein [Chloroflexota bacterium]
MRRYFYWLFFLYLILIINSSALALKQFDFQIRIDSPRPGDAVQGIVPIIGNTEVRGFISFEIMFALSGDATQNWFEITTSLQAIEDDILGEWDTNTLTDGTYTLRLTVEIEDEESVIILLDGLRLRNYTAIETNTPAPTFTPDPGQTPTPTITPLPPTPTPLPPNPAELSPQKIRVWFVGGAIGALGILVMLWFYTSARKKRMP